MIILGLDTGIKTGWCFYNAKDRKVIESGVQDFTKRRGESNGLMFLRFRKWLNDVVGFLKPAIVAYELAHHRGGAATVVGIGFTTRVEEICAKHDIELASIHSKTLKIFATGSGKAGKPEMMKAVIKFLGREPIDDNEADAIWVSIWAAKEFAI